LSATATLPLNPNNSPIAKLIIRLNGSATTPYTLGVTFQNIMAGGATGMNVPAENTQTFTFLRGDANGNGTVSMGDAMFIAQYLVGLRPLTDLNIVNSASVKQDGTAGDVISIADAMFIAQYLVGLRNANYN
jgi:hypothetical protein